MNVIILPNQSLDLEEKLPIDRCVTVDDNSVTNLYDTEFVISKDMIQEIVHD